MRTEDSVRVRTLATERGLTSCMNETKWSEVCELFRHWSPLPSFRIRDLLASEGYVSEWDSEWYYHPYPYVSIQWLEVRLPSADVQRAVSACKELGAAVEVAGAGVRIWGWFGSLDRPQFA